MSTKSNEKFNNYCTIAAICYVIRALVELIDIIHYYGCLIITPYIGFNFMFYRSLCLSVVTAIALFLKSKKILFIIYTIRSLRGIYSIFTNFSFLNLLSIVFTDFSILTLIILTLKNNELVKKLWYIPGLYRLIIFPLFFIDLIDGNLLISPRKCL